MSVQRRIHLDWLTALRFFAAFAVLLCHLVAPYGITGRGHDALVFGQFGVDFFFVLSGFVLTWSHKPARTAARFYWLRFARVWPLHAVVMVLLFLIGVRAPWTDTALQAVLLQQWNPHTVFTEGLNGVSWTLSVEAFFYALFPLLVVALARLTTRRLAVACAALWMAHFTLIVAGHGWPEPFKDWATFSNPAVRVPQFVLGIAIALGLQRCDTSTWNPRAVRVFQVLGLAMLATGWLVYSFSGGGHLALWTWLLTPIMGAIVAGFAAAGIALGDAAPRVLVALGEWSFALYLVHRGLVYAHALPRLMAWPTWVAVPAVILVSIAVAGVAHELFEKPVEKWLRARGPRERISVEGTAHEAPAPTDVGTPQPQSFVTGA